MILKYMVYIVEFLLIHYYNKNTEYISTYLIFRYLKQKNTLFKLTMKQV